MKAQGMLFFCIMLTVGNMRSLTAETMKDPYQIWGKYLAAQGGSEKLKSIKSQRQDGTITILASGLKGTFKQWRQDMTKNRQEIDLKVFKQVEGSNGQVSWVVDSNGKVQIVQDENTLKRKRIEALMLDPDNLKPGSPYFQLSLKGEEMVDASSCYVIEISNTINSDKEIYFINKKTYLAEKSIANMPDSKEITLYSDYREIGGIKSPFKMKTETQPPGMITLLEIQHTEFGAAIDAALFDIPKLETQDFTFLNGDCAENISFKFIGRHLYLSITIKGKSTLWCLDSGAERSIVDVDYATEIGLAATEKLKGQGAGKAVDFSFVTLPAFQIANIQFKEQKIVAMPLKTIFQIRTGLDVSGLLGYDFLSRFITRIDYAKQLVSFYDPDHFSYQGQGKAFSAPLRHNFFTVNLTVDGKWNGAFTLDIGAGTTDFDYPYAKEHKLLDLKGLERMGAGAGGQYIMRQTRFQCLDINGFKILKPILGFPVNPSEGTLGSEEVAGILGNDILHRFVLFLDYKNQQIILEKGQNFGQEFPEDRSGATIGCTETNDPVVIFVASGSPAAEAGLKKDDLILQVNGASVIKSNGIIALREMLADPAVKFCKLIVRRQNGSKNILIKLKDLL